MSKILKKHGRVGKKHSKKTLKKMSLAKLGKKQPLSQRMARSKNAKNNSNYGMKGKKHKEESKIKMSLNRIGKYIGENNHNWRGENVKYGTKHDWIRTHFGSASNYKCKLCSKQAYHWSDKYHKSSRNINDYWPLCISCHMKWDYNHNNRKTRWGTIKLKKFVN